MKVGAEPRKIAVLAVLMSFASYLIYSNILSGPETGEPPPRAQEPAPPPTNRSVPPGRERAVPGPPPVAPARGLGSQEFRPSLKSRRSDEAPDPMTIDPTLQLGLLAKLSTVEISGGMRSLFDFSQAPPPKVPEPKILPATKPVQGPEPPPKPEDIQVKEAPKPPPPPIPLKFYGYVAGGGGGSRRAFFLNDDEILVGGEGDLIKSRYKVIRIGLKSAVVEDTQHKHQQTLALVEEQPSA